MQKLLFERERLPRRLEQVVNCHALTPRTVNLFHSITLLHKWSIAKLTAKLYKPPPPSPSSPTSSTCVISIWSIKTSIIHICSFGFSRNAQPVLRDHPKVFPLKCFVSHRPTDPVVLEKRKKKTKMLSFIACTHFWVFPSLIHFIYILKWALTSKSALITIFPTPFRVTVALYKMPVTARIWLRLARNYLFVHLSVLLLSAFILCSFKIDRPTHFYESGWWGTKYFMGMVK